MTITTLHQCLQFPNKTPIQAVRATLVSLNQTPLVGQTQHGPYSILTGELREGQTTMTVKFFDRTDVGQHMLNQLLVLSAVEGKKGFAGLSITEYEGRKQLKVDNRAQVIPQDSGQSQATPTWQGQPPHQGPPYVHPAAAAPQYQQAPPAPQTFFPASPGYPAQVHAPTAPPPQQAPTPSQIIANLPPAGAPYQYIPMAAAQQVSDPGREAKRTLSRAGGCYAACYAVGLYTARQIKRQTGEDIGQEQFQAMVSSLFIYSDKHHIVDTFEPLDMKGPAPWEEAKTSSGNTAVGPSGVTQQSNAPVITPFGQPLPPSRQTAPPAEDDVPF